MSYYFDFLIKFKNYLFIKSIIIDACEFNSFLKQMQLLRQY